MIDMVGKAVFISGPMTGLRHFNVAKFCDVHAALRLLDVCDVYNPALCWLRDPQVKRTQEHYMRQCISELTRTDVHGEPYYDYLIRLVGWNDSEGAKLESAVAEACGIEVVDWLLIEEGIDADED